jgi:hypothetical protein
MSEAIGRPGKFHRQRVAHVALLVELVGSAAVRRMGLHKRIVNRLVDDAFEEIGDDDLLVGEAHLALRGAEQRISRQALLLEVRDHRVVKLKKRQLKLTHDGIRQ